MAEIIATTDLILAILGIGVGIGAALLLIDFKGKQVLAGLVRTYGLLSAFILTTGSTVMGFVYSDVFGFVPCGLCWLQRVFLFPQVILLGMAIYYKDKAVARYGIVLSSLGTIIALYQHYLQVGGSSFLPCPASGGDCAKRYFYEFDFLTFPLMSAFVFVFLIILYMYILKTRTSVS